MPPTSNKFEACWLRPIHVSACLRVSITLSCGRKKNRLTFEMDIWYTAPWPYLKMLISLGAGCDLYYQSYVPFCTNMGIVNKGACFLETDFSSPKASHVHSI